RGVPVPGDAEDPAAVDAEELVGDRGFERGHAVDEHRDHTVTLRSHGRNLAVMAVPDNGGFLAYIGVPAGGADAHSGGSSVETGRYETMLSPHISSAFVEERQ